jgi:hypothetical protein
LRNSNTLGSEQQRVLYAKYVELMHASDLLGNVERLRWPGQPICGVGAGQRLDAEQGLRVEVPDRLKQRLQAPLVDEPHDGLLLLGGGHDHALANVLEVRRAVASLALGLVQRGVGLCAQCVGLLSGAQRAHTNADLDAGVLQGAGESPRDDPGAVGIGVRQRQRELVAPDSVRAIPGPCLSEDLRHTPEYLVTVRMTVAVVDELEVIDVQQRQREVIVVACGGSDGLRELVLEGTLVRKVGQPVAGGSLQDHAMVAHQATAAEEIEDGATADQGDQRD